MGAKPRAFGRQAVRLYRRFSAFADDKEVGLFIKERPWACRMHVANGSRPDPQCFNSVRLYDWKPFGLPHMRAAGAEAPSLCRAMKSLGYRRLVFLGDSIMRNQANSMWGVMGANGINTFRSRGVHALRCSDESLISVELERMPPPGMLPALLKARSLQDMEEPPDSQATQAWLGLQSALNDSRALCVINMGAHYPGDFNLTSGPAFRGFTRDMLALRALVRLHEAAGRLVYRTTPAGHPGCESFRVPDRPAESATVASYARWSSMSGAQDARFDTYGWEWFAGYDRVARDILEPLGVAFLDVTILSALRPDAHTAFRHGGGRLPPDCLHWSLPGVPDAWNRMLIAALEHCPFRSGAGWAVEGPMSRSIM